MAEHLAATVGVHVEPDALVSDLLDAVIAELSVSITWRPGAVDLLQALEGAGVPCGLVTMSDRRLATVVAGHLPGAFRLIVPGDEVGRGKPAPDPYLRAADLLGVVAGACVVIEDSLTGVASGEA